MVMGKCIEGNCFLTRNEKYEHICHSFIQGMNFPLCCLGCQSLEDTSSEGLSCSIEEEESILDSLLLSQWEDRMWKGCFSYDVTTSEIKVIAGKMKFFSQLNERQITDHLSRPEGDAPCEWSPFVYDCLKYPEKLLFCVTSGTKPKAELIPSATVPDSAILVIINVTPVEYGHVFLVPFTSNRLHQFLEAGSIEIVARIAADINNNSFRIFYSCCSSNGSDVYFQACYFPDPLTVEFRPLDVFFSGRGRGFCISSVEDYPVKTLSFQTNHNLKEMAEATNEICSHLEEMNVQYSLMISDSGSKIFLFLLRSFPNSDAISAWECGGYFVFRSRHDFDQVTEDTLLERLKSFSLDDDSFESVIQLCRSIAGKFDI